jgi:nucleotide-binding universal stress UspA family protein
MPVIRHILVATDFGEPAACALEYALMLGKALDAKVTLFHAFYVPPIAYGDGSIPVPVDDWIDGAHNALAQQVEKAKATWPRVESAFAIMEPRQGILEAAESKKPDLIVIGTHGRRGLSRVLLGSVAEHVVRASPVPVLTIHVA